MNGRVLQNVGKFNRRPVSSAQASLVQNQQNIVPIRTKFPGQNSLAGSKHLTFDLNGRKQTNRNSPRESKNPITDKVRQEVGATQSKIQKAAEDCKKDMIKQVNSKNMDGNLAGCNRFFRLPEIEMSNVLTAIKDRMKNEVSSVKEAISTCKDIVSKESQKIQQKNPLGKQALEFTRNFLEHFEKNEESRKLLEKDLLKYGNSGDKLYSLAQKYTKTFNTKKLLSETEFEEAHQEIKNQMEEEYKQYFSQQLKDGKPKLPSIKRSKSPTEKKKLQMSKA